MTNLKTLTQKDLPPPVLSTGQAIVYAFLFTFVKVYKNSDEMLLFHMHYFSNTHILVFVKCYRVHPVNTQCSALQKKHKIKVLLT